eukprot:5643266-Alexandrium_andersonii.AAC.1
MLACVQCQRSLPAAGNTHRASVHAGLRAVPALPRMLARAQSFPVCFARAVTAPALTPACPS